MLTGPSTGFDRPPAGDDRPPARARPRLIVIGGGISGLVAGYVMDRFAQVTVVEAESVGGEFAAGGLRLLNRTHGTVRLMTDLLLPYSVYSPRGGMMLRGDVVAFPACFDAMDTTERGKVQRDYWVKTRRTAPPSDRNLMPDAARNRVRTCLRCDFADLVSALSDRLRIIPGRVDVVDRSRVRIAPDRWLAFDYLVSTVPLWAFDTAWAKAPECAATKLTRYFVVPHSDHYTRWDFIHVPYSPADAVFRMVHDSDGWIAEVAGSVEQSQVQSDLNWIFPAGYYVRRVQSDMKGFLVPPAPQVSWPDWAQPVGRYAEWKSGSTAADALDRAIELSRHWFHGGANESDDVRG